MNSAEVSVEKKRAASLSQIEKNARRLADDYITIDKSKTIIEKTSIETRNAEKLVSDLQAKGASRSSVYEAENALRKVKYEKNEAELKMKEADADAQEIRKKVTADLPLVKKQGDSMFIRGEVLPILFAPSGQLKNMQGMKQQYTTYNINLMTRFMTYLKQIDI